jgi:hypothetical protein
MMRQRIAGGTRRTWWLTGVALVAAAATPLGAQGTGNGYLFGEPTAGLTIRAGYAIASANSDFFNIARQDLTLDKSDFNSPTFGAELAFRLAPQIDFTLDAAWAGVNRHSHYRDFVDGDGNEIEQTTSIRRVPVTANLRAYLMPRGRSVGSLAYIPAKVVPWVGVGAGATWYKAEQSGDFMNVPLCTELQTDAACAVFSDRVVDDGWGPALQGMGGVDVTLSPRIAVTGDARYLWSKASMGESFGGYDKIDLSGVFLTLGLTFRL